MEHAMNVSELARLSLTELIALLAQQPPSPERSSPGDWRAVLYVLSSRTASARGDELATNRHALWRAYGSVLAGASTYGDVDDRESAIAQVHYLALLASRLRHGDEAREFSALAEQLALSHAPLSFGEAREATWDWRSQPIDRIRDLRFAKNLFTPLRALGRSSPGSAKAHAVDRWVALLPHLP
ncbi:hypothetical protein [Thalassiella azotivora]